MNALDEPGAVGPTFGLLGPLRVLRDGEPVALGGARQRAVLARLLIEPGRVVSLTGLADAIWGEAVPRGYASTLQTYVFHLREALEPDRAAGTPAQILVTEAGGYRLTVTEKALDTVRFEQLVGEARNLLGAGHCAAACACLDEALTLWRGPALDDLSEFGFVSPLQARLEQAHLDAVELRLEALLGLGRPAEVAAQTATLLERHALRERLHGLRMLALYRCGRQAEALEAFAGLRRVLDDELGIEPGPEVRELHVKILNQDPALDVLPPNDGAAGAGHPPDRISRRDVRAARSPRPARRAVIAGAAVLLAAGVTVAVVATRHSSTGPAGIAGDSLVRLRPDGTVSAAMPLAFTPAAVVATERTAWVADSAGSTVHRFDLRTRTGIVSVPLTAWGAATPVAMVIYGDSVWVANAGTDNVSRISTATDHVVDSVPVGHRPSAIAAGFGRLWVADAADATVSVIDPSRYPARVLPPIPVGTEPDGIAVGAGAVWVADRADSTVSRIDPDAREVRTIRVGAGPVGVAVVGSSVWTADSLDLTVSRLDPGTSTVTISRVGDTPLGIADFAGAPWVGTAGDGKVSRLDPGTGQVNLQTVTKASPRVLASVGSSLWVASQGFVAGRHRGGALTVVAADPESLPGIDPATAYDAPSPFLMAVVYDGLLGLHRSDGSAAFEVVPDLALTLPTVRGGGTVYTFTLRSGIRYSDGRRVRASDFRRALERHFPLAAKARVPTYLSGIVGAVGCQAHPDRPCSLRQGVRTDDRAGTVTISLIRADGDFLEKLAAFDYAAPVPPGTSTHDVGARPIPGTGPYTISTFRKGHVLALTRNRYFHIWSTVAQPDGYPDVIRLRADLPTQAAAIDAVTHGRADLVALNDVNDNGLQATYAGRVWQSTTNGTFFVLLNTRVTPFDRSLARRAAAYALNGDPRFAAVLGGQPSCTFLPPDSIAGPGSCPGRPDLAIARQLVRRSGTLNATVHVYAPDFPAVATLFRHVTRVLDDIGYRATLTVEPHHRWPTDMTAYDARSRPVNAQPMQWWPDYSAPSQFYVPMLSCTDGPFGQIVGCRPDLDHLADQALNAQVVDPAGAQRLWEKLYATVDDDARVIAVANLPLNVMIESKRLGNTHFNGLGILLDQLWVH